MADNTLEFLSTPLAVDRAAIDQLLKDPRTAKGKYIRLFTTPGKPRSAAHMQDFIIDVTNLDEDIVDELTMDQIGQVFSAIMDAINTDAVDPTMAGNNGNGLTAASTSGETEKAIENA